MDGTPEHGRGHRRRRLVITIAVVKHPGGEADRRIRQSIQCLRARCHHLCVGASLRKQYRELLVSAAFVGGETGWRWVAGLKRFGDVRWNCSRKVGVNGQQLRRRLFGHRRANARTQVAALCHELRVTEALHQHDPGARGALGTPAGSRRPC